MHQEAAQGTEGKGVGMSVGASSGRRHRLLGALAGLGTFAAALNAVARQLPSWWQSQPYVPILVSLTPWFAVVALVGLVLALISRRWFVALIALCCLVAQGWWQYPFFHGTSTLSSSTTTAVGSASVRTDDDAARVMTANVYRGHADAQTIVDIVRDQRVEVLTLQETTPKFVTALKKAGIEDYLPYSVVSSADGTYGNGLWSAAALANPSDDEVDSLSSFMPAGTVDFANGRSVRFVSVHTTSPKPGNWTMWRTSLEDVAKLGSTTGKRYVLMGDFNSTVDHTPFRELLGSRFSDAAYESGHGFTFTWPANRSWLPAFSGIDHVVIDKRITAGQVTVVSIPGSDHKGLLATLQIDA
ncbi:endonuclease/exonuclease/phosphatase family protein [uncultured Bifidobacterium sp.]|uniref:endonuclease/exonuclease/phosphatase family protein n=1 Tax=uncultured Bifidobacterium sp. TaxID=165187 RepID=UPI0026207A1D|nr:endonuclease/exonuclease/phosphatase family protein [uncultured Bifidobacterium sp.]